MHICLISATEIHRRSHARRRAFSAPLKWTSSQGGDGRVCARQTRKRGLGANVYIPADAICGGATGLGFGLSAAVLGCLLWYGPVVLRGTREGQPTGGNSMRQLKKDEGTGHCAAGKLIGCDLQPRIWLKPWNANGRNTRTPKREFNTRACSVRSWRQRGHWKLALEPREL